MRLAKLVIVSPRNATIALANHHKTLAAGAGSVDLDPLAGTSSDGPTVVELAIHTPKTPGEDQGSVVEIEGTALELSGAERTLRRRAKAVMPPEAVKIPSL
jgi:hypothetical protein